ncbi:MAG TPA: STAS domain-containing protein [Cellulomonas sp.]
MDQTDDLARHGGIDVTTAGGCTLVRLWGEVDVALREDASASMARALASTDPIVVDATGVTFIDSSGLAFVLQLHLAASETGQPLTLRDPHRELVDRLALLGLDRGFVLEPTRAIA